MKRALLLLGIIAGALMTFAPPIMCGIGSVTSLWIMAREGAATTSPLAQSCARLTEQSLYVGLFASPLGLVTFTLCLVFYLRTRKTPQL